MLTDFEDGKDLLAFASEARRCHAFAERLGL